MNTVTENSSNVSKVGLGLAALAAMAVVGLGFFRISHTKKLLPAIDNISLLGINMIDNMGWIPYIIFGGFVVYCIVGLIIKNYSFMIFSVLATSITYLSIQPELYWRYTIASGTATVGCFVYTTQECQQLILKQPASVYNQYPSMYQSRDTREYTPEYAAQRKKIEDGRSKLALVLTQMPGIPALMGIFVSDKQFETRLQKSINRHHMMLSGAKPDYEGSESTSTILNKQ